jgi:predicted TIM-barrel fold metal-dependent hydrolase
MSKRPSHEPPHADGGSRLTRRGALAHLGAFVAAPAVAAVAGPPMQPAPAARLRKIATEEAFMIPEIAAAVRDLVRRGGSSLDLNLLRIVYDSPPAPAAGPSTGQSSGQSSGAAPASRDALARLLLPQLLDADAARLAEMDANRVDMHVLALGVPGVQMFEAGRAVALARLANDRLAAIVRRHPARFAGLAAFTPQDPKSAVQEMERAVGPLGLNGFLVNSHTDGVYLDDPRCWPILEAAEALGKPLYIHPRAPSDGMAGPFRDYRLEGAIWGYAVEAGTHAMRLMLSGVLDRFPRLQLVLGHMGEALPFWLWRLDFMASPGSRAALRNQLKPSEYMRRNFAITTSGVEDPLVLRFCIDKLGVDRIMWAIDHPYQPTPPAVTFIENAPLSDAERRAVASGNAERIFGIGV